MQVIIHVVNIKIISNPFTPISDLPTNVSEISPSYLTYKIPCDGNCYS